MSGPSISDRIGRLPRSGIRGIMELALELEDVVRLEIGDPDFATPAHIVDAAAEAARAGFTHYSPGVGLRSLRIFKGIECLQQLLVEFFVAINHEVGAQ